MDVHEGACMKTASKRKAAQGRSSQGRHGGNRAGGRARRVASKLKKSIQSAGKDAARGGR